VQDAPISHVDLLLCRNTLMYFNAETQARIAQRLHFALNPSGTVFLGKAEMLLSHGALFVATDLRHRFFRKVVVKAADRVPMAATLAVDTAAAAPDPDVRIWREALMSSTSAQLVLDPSTRLSLSNRRADALFALGPRDVGRPFQDLEVSYRPVELRSAVQEAHAQRRTVDLRDTELRRGNGRLWFDIQVVPLLDASGRALGTLLGFTDVSSCAPSWSTRTASWRRRTRSCSRPTRSSRPPTRSCSRRSRSWRRRTRSSSRPTRSSRP